MKRCEANTLDASLPHLSNYWNERDTRARQAKADAHQRALNATIDAGMAELNERQRIAWANAEKATDALIKGQTP